MKTTLTAGQIIDLGGIDLLKKVHEYNNRQFDPDGCINIDEVLTFDSKFEKCKIDLCGHKAFTYYIRGKVDEQYYGIIFKETKEQAVKTLKRRFDWLKVDKDDVSEIDIANIIMLEDGIIQI